MKPQQHNVNIDPNKLPTEVCQCGSYFWKNVNIIKEVSGLLIGSPQNQFMVYGILVCAKCETPHVSVKINLPTKDELPQQKVQQHIANNTDDVKKYFCVCKKPNYDTSCQHPFCKTCNKRVRYVG